VPNAAKPLGLVDDGAVGWTGSYVHYIWQKPKKKRKLKVTQRRDEEALSSDKPYKLKEKIDDMMSMPSEGLQEEPTTTQEGMPSSTTANGTGMRKTSSKNKNKKTKKQKKTFFLTSQMLTTDMPHG